MPVFQPTQNMQVSSALKIDPQLQPPTPHPSNEKELKPHGLTPKKLHGPFYSTRISPSLSPTTCFGNCNIYLASCPSLPRNAEQRGHAWQKRGMARAGGRGGKKKNPAGSSTSCKHRWLFSAGMHGPESSPASRSSPRPASPAPGGPRGREQR